MHNSKRFSFTLNLYSRIVPLLVRLPIVLSDDLKVIHFPKRRHSVLSKRSKRAR